MLTAAGVGGLGLILMGLVLGRLRSSTDASLSTVRAWCYLRLRAGRRYITVRCRQSAGFRKTWGGSWEQGRRSRRWHITPAPADFVLLSTPSSTWACSPWPARDQLVDDGDTKAALGQRVQVRPRAVGLRSAA